MFASEAAASPPPPESAARSDCVFCGIVAGRLPAQRIDEDERTVAFLDINPWTRGHTLVVPRAHSESILDAPDDDLAAVALAARRVAERLRRKLGCAGVNVFSAAGSVAWQTVFHFHVHVIPRYRDDGLEPPITPRPADAEQLAALAEQLRG